MADKYPLLHEKVILEFAGAVTGQIWTVSSSLLGAGNFSDVYRGYSQVNRSRVVAIKVTRPKHDVNPDRYAKYLGREIEFVQMRLDHPNVLSLLDYAQVGEQKVCFVMEHCDAGTLKSFLAANKPLPEADIKHFFSQIVMGLKYLHSRDIIHRDLKPENFLLQSDIAGGKPILKIADFGLSRQVQLDELDNQLHMTMLGTPLYVSPEIYGGQSYGFATDLWGIGAILFEMVEGQHLLRSEDLPILRSKRLIDVKARLQRALSVEYAAEVITRLLSFDPKDRCSLEWILEHPFLQKENIPIYLKVFSVNRATALTLLLNVPRGPRYVQYLIEELNRKVPPFPPKRSAHSQYSLVGQSEYQTFYRLYLWDDGTLVKLTPTLDDVLSRSQIFMYHLDNPDDEFIVEDGFVLIDNKEIGNIKQRRISVIDEMARYLAKQATQVEGLGVLHTHLRSQFANLNGVAQGADLETKLTEANDLLKTLQFLRLKELARSNPLKLQDAFGDFLILVQEKNEFSRIISQFSVTHQNIKAELDVVLRAYDEAQASLERAMKQREQLKKAAQDTRQDQFNQLNFEWMCEYILNSDLTKGIRRRVCIAVRQNIKMELLAAQITETAQALGDLQERAQKLRAYIMTQIAAGSEITTIASQELLILRSDLQAKSADQLTLRKRNEELESALEAKTLALQHSRDELTLIQKRLEASNTLGSSQGKSTAELEAALAQNKELRERNETLEAREAVLKSNLAIQAEELEKVRDAQDQRINELESEIEALRARVQSYEFSGSKSALSRSAEISDKENITSQLLMELDAKNAALLDAKEQLSTLQNAFVDEKLEKQKLRNRIAELTTAAEQAQQLGKELTATKEQMQILEQESVRFSDFSDGCLVAMQLNAQGHYYLLYTPADPSKYCWVLMDPQVESLLEITPKPHLLIAELLMVPDFEAAVQAKNGEFGLLPGSLYTFIIARPKPEILPNLVK